MSDRIRNEKGAFARLCRCDFGTERIVIERALKHGYSQSCGCGRIKDIAGQRFGHLTAIERSEQYIVRHDSSKRYLWKCICDCGNVVYRLPEKMRDNIESACDESLNKDRVADMIANAGFIEGTQLTKIADMHPTAANTSGVRGVIWNKRTQKWRAMLVFQKKRHYLGEYRNFEDAVKARKNAEDEYYLPILEYYQKKPDET